jgi:hypothetical protein
MQPRIAKVAGILSGNCVPLDWFRESMDSYRIVVMNPDSKKVQYVPYETNPGFILYCRSRIRT